MSGRSLFLALTMVGALALPSAVAHGQSPGRCARAPERPDYGTLQVGSIVVPQRHRFVASDPNWDPRMGRFLGRVARITQLSGVDVRGCPGVRLDVDGGRFFWRARDLGRQDAAPALAVEPETLPQGCGQSPRAPNYGSLREGARVVLGRHRPVGGDPNWEPRMEPLIGHTARVVELLGTDERGCPGVRVDADGGEWFWRVRDLRVAEDGGGPFPPGLASDHGRPEMPAATPENLAGAPGDPRVPQACGLTDETAVYAPVGVGSQVVLGRHRPVDGEDNWTPGMERYAGRVARVIELVGVDEQGCPLLRVDVDEGGWVWRLRDVLLP